MGLADGDPFVSGSILSYQQAERIRDNWRAASAPSNPQPGSLWSESDTERIFHRKASSWGELIQLGVQGSGYIDLVHISTAAGGAFAFRIDAYQDDTTALTGLLRGAYIQASNGDEDGSGTIRALELKARAGRPGETGANIAVLEGLFISADAKTYDITTVMRGAEISLDGASGSTITKAVGLRIAQNFQADIATLCYGLEIYRDSFDYDADIALSSGGLIGGKAGHLRITDTGVVSIYDEDLIDRLFLYHDKTDAFIKWSDGALNLQTTEADANSIVDLHGNGTGVGHLKIYDEDDAEFLSLSISLGAAHIQTSGANPLVLNLQSITAKDIRCWASIGAGNPYFYIYGYKTGVGVKYLRDFVDSNGFARIEGEDGITLAQSGGKLGFYGLATPVVQAGHIGDTGGDDAAVVNAILVVLENLGLIASA